MKEIIVDGTTLNKSANMRYRGAGMVSGNGSSRLLLDYKREHPEAYRKILEYTFGKDGIGVNHLKLEMGSDINSSSGTEPSVKRNADEKANTARGAGYILAADAKRINPDLTLDMLWWSEPKWITDSEDVYAARYKWYKETLDSAYETYGLKFDYVSAVRNEREYDLEWVKYLSAHLKSETDCPYDYSSIKIVGGDEVCTWSFADRMYEDAELMKAVDVVGSHYTSFSTDAAQKLASEHKKELWLSEGSPAMCYARGVSGLNGSGLSGLNGALDIANRFIGMYPNGKMTLYEYQPVIAAYYDGVNYCHKQLISACDPWSGFFELDSSFYIALHFSRFIQKGWEFADSACFSDGKAKDHSIVDAVYSYMTAADPETGDYSIVIANSTSEPIEYAVKVSDLGKAAANVNIWETRGPDSGDFDENYFKKISMITPEKTDNIYTYKITVKPYSVITVSTVMREEREYKNADERERTVMELPYSDNFEYSEYPDNYLVSRGYAPRYTTDQGGAFEVETTNDKNVLVQQITPEMKAEEWGATPDPLTTLGDDRWFNYSISADAAFKSSDRPSENYVGIGLRYTLALIAYSGYWIQLFENGNWKLKANGEELISGRINEFDGKTAHRLKIEAEYNIVRAYIDGEKTAECIYKSGAFCGAGRAALYSSYNKNSFGNLLIEPLTDDVYITRCDNTDLCVNYSGDWTHDTMSGYKNYHRTISHGKAGCSFTVNFDGTGIAFTGETEKAVLSVEIDGRTETKKVTQTGTREISCFIGRLEKSPHTVKVTVVDGEYSIDGFQILGGEIPLEKHSDR